MPVVGSILKTTMRGLEKNVVSPMLKEAEQLLGPKIGLFSKLEQEVSRLNFTKMPAEQLRKTMTGRQVSPAETESVLGGLEGTVNREQVQGAIAERGMKLKDVVLGDFTKEQHEAAKAGAMDFGEGEAFEKLKPKFSSYQEPGAVSGSYREMFVTAPTPESKLTTLPAGWRTEQSPTTGNWSSIRPNGGQEVFGHPTEESVIKRTLSLIRPHENTWADGHSAYSDIQNPIVRIRFNKREVNDPGAFDEAAQDSFGKSFSQLTEKEKASLADVVPKKKKVLFVEEIQGPSEANQAKMPEALRKRIYDIGVKRVLAYAKENGFDGVAWTTGKMQVDRYPGVKQLVDTISWRSVGAAGKTVIVTPKGKDYFTIRVDSNGDVLSTAFPQFKNKNIVEVLGKDIGEKIKSESVGEMSNLDFEVGGEGLKSLYDKTLPSKFKKYGKEEIKKLEIPLLKEMKVEQTDTGFTKTPIVDNVTVPYIPITEKTPSRYPIYSAGPVGAIMKMLQEEKEKGNAQSTYHR